MNNIFDRDLKSPKTDKRVVHSSDILPGTIQQRHLESNLYAVKFGLAADRPTTPGEDGSYFVFFATDTGVLSMWDGSSWLSTTLT